MHTRESFGLCEVCKQHTTHLHHQISTASKHERCYLCYRRNADWQTHGASCCSQAFRGRCGALFEQLLGELFDVGVLRDRIPLCVEGGSPNFELLADLVPQVVHEADAAHAGRGNQRIFQRLLASCIGRAAQGGARRRTHRSDAHRRHSSRCCRSAVTHSSFNCPGRRTRSRAAGAHGAPQFQSTDRTRRAARSAQRTPRCPRDPAAGASYPRGHVPSPGAPGG